MSSLLRKLAKPFRGPISGIMSPRPSIRDVPRLGEVHFRNCRFFADRREMLSIVPKAGVGAEIGVFRGDFSEVLLSDLEPAELTLIDCKFQVDMNERFGAAVRDGVVRLIEGDSSSELARFPERHFDWIYIDGDHSHEGVVRDVAVAVTRVKSAGCLIFNDYKMGDHNHPNRFYEYGVIHEVNRLCLEEAYELRGFAFHSQMYCDVLIKKRES